MANFLALFDTHVAELEAGISDEATPESAAEAVRSFLERLYDHWMLTKPQEAETVAARGGIEILQAGAGVMVAASRTEVWQQAGAGTARKRHRLWTRVVAGVVAVVMAAYLGLVLWTFQRWTELVLLGVAVAAELVRVAAGFGRKKHEAQIRSLATIHVDRQALVRRLSHAVRALDKLVESAASLRPTIASAGPVVEDPAFTELLQDLMEARETADGEYAIRVLRSLRSTLERHGIQVVSYDGANRQLFEFQPSLQRERGDQTLRPALVQEGRLLRRGLVAEAQHVR